VPYLAGFSNMIEVEAAAGEAPDAVRRLAALAVMVTEDAERLSQKLRLSNPEQARLLSMAQVWWRRIVPADDALARPWLYRLGPDDFLDRVLMAWARWGAPADDAQWRALASLPQRWSVPKFPLTSADFISRGIEKGPKLGEALRKAEQGWIEADFPSDPAALKAIADRYI
jgi:poly(A) polymerase